jgi:hypothetical protein
MDMIAQLKAVDQATLSPFVRQALDSQSAVVIDSQVAPIAGGARHTLYRFAGSAEAQGKIVPWSLVLKVVPASTGNDEPANWCYWKRESLVYQSGLLADLPGGLRAPRCFGVVELPNGDNWLWLEEITDAATGCWSRERFTSVARQLGRFSAAYLTGRPLPTYPWLSQGWFRGKVASAALAVAELPRLVDHPLLRPAFPGDTAARVLQLWDERDVLCTAIERLPQTFCHLDAFPRNLFVRNMNGGEVQIVAIDWEFAGVSALGAELAPLVGGSLLFGEAGLAEADDLEAAVFASYLEGLREAGWRGDPQIVRLGYTLALALLYVFLGLAPLEEGTHNPGLRQFGEQLFGCSYREILERSAVLYEFQLAHADEARRLLRSL